MKFSLILATYNRLNELIPFLDSLQNQTYKNFELIIVDQNNNDNIHVLCQKYLIDIKIIKSNKKGLSLNRNIGLKHVSGDIIAFPDDDCEYDKTTLEKVHLFFINNNRFNFYTCNSKDKQSEKSISSTLLKNSKITIFNVMKAGISITIFVRTEAIKQFNFDEQLGIGAAFGSGEESDLLFFLLKNKNKGFYFADDFIYHPAKEVTIDRITPYGKGFGAVFKKAITKYHFLQLIPLFVLYLIKNLFDIVLKKDKKFQFVKFNARLIGFLQYKKDFYSA